MATDTENSEKLAKRREYVRRWRVANREKIRKKAKQQYAANPEKYREQARLWRVTNPEKVLERSREYTRRKLSKPGGRERAKEYNRQWYVKNRILVQSQRYNISPELLLQMEKEHAGCCAICDRRQRNRKRTLAVDHDHSTGMVRGLLCDRCNQTVGQFQDDPSLFERAAAYLRRTSCR